MEVQFLERMTKRFGKVFADTLISLFHAYHFAVLSCISFCSPLCIWSCFSASLNVDSPCTFISAMMLETSFVGGFHNLEESEIMKL